MRLASSANLAAPMSPEPTAISPRHRAVAAGAVAAAGAEQHRRAHDEADDRQSSVVAMATAAMVTMSTITEVSTRLPCQVMATSPGRSASQTAAKATQKMAR
jgi:hypothetical protein